MLAKSILDAAHAVLPELEAYGVTAEVLEDLQARISAALEGIHQPRTGIVECKTATTRLIAFCDEIDALLDNQIDRLVYRVRKSFPGAHARYRSAREVITHTGGRGQRGPTPTPASTPVAAAFTSASEKNAA